MLSAGAQLLSGERYIIVIRILQLLAGIATAWICSRIGAEIGGLKAGRLCFVLVLFYPSEPVLNQMAMRSAARLWSHAGVHGLVVIAEKLGYFWLSTDQLLDTQRLPLRVRLIRAMGVGVYWVCLVCGLAGLISLRKKDRQLATTLMVHLGVATALHLFFAMNTRLRVPLVDPMLCVLVSFAIAGEDLRASAVATGRSMAVNKPAERVPLGC